MPLDLTRIPSTPPPSYDGDVATWADAVNRYLGEQLGLLQQLTGGELRWQNLRSELILDQDVPAGTAPITITQNHNLNTVPSAYLVMPITPRAIAALEWDLHATVSDRAAWTATSVQLTYDDTTQLLNPTVSYDLWLLV